MSRNSIGITPTLSLIGATALWAVATVISKKLLATVPPIALLVAQLVPSVILLWILAAVSRLDPLRWRVLVPVALLGCLNPGMSYTLSLLGLTRTTASVATLLWAAEPALIVGLAWLILRERLTAGRVAATVVAAFGVVMVSGVASGSGVATGGLRGDALILGGVLCCALYTVLARKITAAIHPLFTVTLQQTVGLTWAVILWPFEWHQQGASPVSTLTSTELLGAAVSGVMYYGAAFWLYLKGLACVPASVAGGFLNLIPVFGIATAFVFLGERLTVVQWAGAGTIILAVFVLLSLEAPRTFEGTSPS
jgi:drug/metabolite transporter (DMT)-like permease